MSNDNVNIIKKAMAIITRATALVMIAIAFLVFSTPSSHAATAGRIFGRLLDGTNKNAPLAGQTITLQMAQGDTARDLTSLTTDAHGSFVFDNLATDKTISYSLYIRYQGAQYNSDIITLDTKPMQHIDLTVYEATTSTANMAIVRATILLRQPDPQKGLISVSELYIFRNLDNHTYVGSLDTTHGKPNALRFSLPHTVHNVSLGKDFSGYKAILVDGGFATDAAIPPGDSQYAFSFDMPYTASTYDFDYTVVYPTIQLSFLIPPEIHATSDALSPKGPITAEQHTFNLFQANALLANKPVHLQLEGLPTPTAIPTSSSSATNLNPNTLWLIVWLIVGLLLMAAILFITWHLYRTAVTQRLAPNKKKQAAQPAKSNKSASAKTNKADKPDKSTDKEQELLQQLLELDKAYEAGKLTKAGYQEKRAKTKARLRALMREKVTS